MSNINDKATVSLFVNGEQAQQAMDRLRQEADNLRQSLQAALAAGDKKQANKLQRDLDKVTKELNRTESAAKGTGIVLQNLANTSIQGLNNALKYLERQLRNTKPDNADWKLYAEQIKAVKERIAELKEEQDGGKSMWDRFKQWADETWPAIDLLKQGYNAVIDFVREYVDAYAQMDQEMANVRKFTGMSASEVGELNEAFKEIDTRTSREQLNQLAQEAGRLGLSSQEDVLGFVRAADKINVALDDLGEGATLTLSKLTDIFGDKQRFGVEDSLLKVGSVINELSQSSTASAPYIAEFASRLGGVGVQANLSVPQIMAFGAVLDANNQKVEASSTAISQVLVRMMQEPAKYATVAGLDVENFSRLLREDANEALLTFLETLNKAGGMDVLAPMFKDMGENGSRAISALTTLANNVDLVRQRQEEANVAFQEGVSIDKEFDVQNTTVQASLEKAQKRFQELRIELGEKLAPVMSHIISSTSALATAVSWIVDFCIKAKTPIIILTTAIVSYTVATKAAALAQKAWSAAVVFGKNVISAFKYTVGLCQVGMIALTHGTKAAGTAFAFLNHTMKANPFGLVISLLATLAVTIWQLVGGIRDAEKADKEWHESLTDIADDAAQAAAKEELRVKSLYQTAINEAKSKDERRKAAEKLLELYPDYFKNMSTEEIMVGKARKQYDELRDSIINAARARAAANKIEQNEAELLSLEEAAPALRSRMETDKKKHDDAVKAWNDAMSMNSNISYSNSTDAAVGTKVNVVPYADEVASTGKAYDASYTEYEENLRKQKQISEANKTLADKYHIAAESIANNNTPATPPTVHPVGDTPEGKGSTSTKDRFAEEKAWREREEALARISYARGESTYSEHTARMSQIAVEYYEKMLAHTDLSEDERLKIEADYAEQINKQASEKNKARLADENSSHQRLLARLRTVHLERLSQEGLTNEERERENDNYEEAVEMSELEHLRRVRDLYEKGSAEWLEAQRAFQEKELSAQERHLKAMEEKQKMFENIKKKYFGTNQPEKDDEFQRQFAALQTVYQQELAAVGDNEEEKLRLKEAFAAAEVAMRKEYNQEVADDTKLSFQDAILKAAEWLESDGGKALTGTLSTVSSGLSSIFSGLSTMIQAEVDIQTAKIEEGYSREVELAQGNSYKVAKLEKKKEKEIAKIKNEANKKMFAMQVIQAVAQTAQNALAAFGSAAAIPVVGYILAPIAAAMAVAAGMIQVAAIKKQQKASEAQGYSQGGFTKPGAVDEPAGIVHAGEWVASQKLLSSPVARPMIDALDYAQRTNTIGSLRAEDVSRSITANNSLARIAESDGGSALVAAAAMKMSQTVDSLTQRLNEPFVTVNTVTGDKGIKQAQDEYNRLLANVTPKSKRR